MLTLLLASIPALAGLLATGLIFQRAGTAQDARRFPPGGRLVETQSGSFHVHRLGPAQTDYPTVVLESGLAGSSLSWVYVQEEIARAAVVYSYDRAGFGWSSAHPSPRSLTTLVGELREVLEAAGARPPYLLVGHSFGGLLVRAFAAAYPSLAAGVVLVDPVSTSAWAQCEGAQRERLERGIRLARRGAWLARFGVIRFALTLVLLGRRFLPKVVVRIAAPGAGSFLTRLAGEIGKLPPSLWPVVRAQWSRPAGFAAIAAYLAALRENCVSAEAEPLRSAVPTTILSAGTATEDERKERDRWLAQGAGGEHRLVEGTGHWIQVERPAAVVRAIEDALSQRLGHG